MNRIKSNPITRKIASLYKMSPYYLPKAIRIDACTLCQLKCPGCFFQNSSYGALGGGFLTIDNFKKIIDNNPQVKQVELSNYGEIFLNPDLVEIMEYAYKKRVRLTANNGVNLNTVSDKQIKALVDYQFASIKLSIDGASQKVYEQYRRGGNIETVIANVRKLIDYKKECNSEYPHLLWKYIIMAHNELEVGMAKKMAAELGIPIKFSLDWDSNYKPVNNEYLIKETGLKELTRTEYQLNHQEPYLGELCRQLFLDPQINWDGKLLGCCVLYDQDYGVNVIDIGLKKALRSRLYLKSKKCLLKKHPAPERYSESPCFKCEMRTIREKYGKVFHL